MLQIFKNTNFDFQSHRRTAFMFSAVLILAGLVFTFMRGGPNYSIDFTGGMQIVLRFDQPTGESLVREALTTIGYPDTEVKILAGGGMQDLMIRVASTTHGEEVIGEIESELSGLLPDNPFSIRSVEQVGPKIGHELRSAAILAIIASLFFIVIYISWRFQYRYAIAAIIALMHDVLIVFGLFAVLDLQISLAIIAAFLTIVGYSLNDTIVVFDRVRENVKKLRSKPLIDQINVSINETLSRTALTSGTTLVVVLVLFFFGGTVIHDFAFAMLAGVIVGTYSSIFVASPVLVEWELKKPEKRRKR